MDPGRIKSYRRTGTYPHQLTTRSPQKRRAPHAHATEPCSKSIGSLPRNGLTPPWGRKSLTARKIGARGKAPSKRPGEEGF
jgi:hypothetical protein